MMSQVTLFVAVLFVGIAMVSTRSYHLSIQNIEDYLDYMDKRGRMREKKYLDYLENRRIMKSFDDYTDNVRKMDSLGSAMTCDANVDLVFLLDASEDARQFFKAQKEFIISMARTLLTQKQSRASVIAYAAVPEIKARLNTYSDFDSFKKAVEEISPLEGKPQLGPAVTTVLSEFTVSSTPDEHKRIGILIYGGNGGSDNVTQQMLRYLPALGIKPVLVGIGRTASQSKLLRDNKDDVVLAETVNVLQSDSFRNKIQGITCPDVSKK